VEGMLCTMSRGSSQGEVLGTPVINTKKKKEKNYNVFLDVTKVVKKYRNQTSN